ALSAVPAADRNQPLIVEKGPSRPLLPFLVCGAVRASAGPHHRVPAVAVIGSPTLRLEKRPQRFVGAHHHLFDSIPFEHISPHLTTCADLDELVYPVPEELDAVIDEHALVQSPR